MQNSVLFRRSIVLPRTLEARLLLEANNVERKIEVNCLSFLGEEDFVAVWNTGVFNDINSVCSVHIDDYEEDVISSNDLPVVIQVLEEKYLKCNDKTLSNFFDNLRQLCIDGLELGMPLFFIF